MTVAVLLDFRLMERFIFKFDLVSVLLILIFNIWGLDDLTFLFQRFSGFLVFSVWDFTSLPILGENIDGSCLLYPQNIDDFIQGFWLTNHLSYQRNFFLNQYSLTLKGIREYSRFWCFKSSWFWPSIVCCLINMFIIQLYYSPQFKLLMIAQCFAFISSSTFSKSS